MSLFIQGLLSYLASSWLEIISTIAGMVGVLYQIRRSVLCFPLGLVWAGTSIIIFYNYQLYSDMLLGWFYVGLMVFGWWSWLRGGEDGTELSVGRLTRKELFIAIGVGIGASALWGFGMDVWTDAAVPYGDALTTWFSLVAQYLLARKLFENWHFWIFVNALAICIYIYKGMHLYVTLYSVFLIMAFGGLIEWKRVLRERDTASSLAGSIPQTAGTST